MVRITFCGHHDEWRLTEVRQDLFACIDNAVKNDEVEFWLGGYGNFDGFAMKCC